ncbi:Na/Pi cotransporter family protein [Candidatus Bathyarchaeota archaeon]|nr:Na/Pi cotransporter family protein [Candidatus Bathyarchaeota archaeon]MBS7630485.1 Na/Pi cotransporter family protein [Candidatus Bathyarchaeota archaeon]
MSLIKSSACALGSDLAKNVLLIVKDTTSGVFAGWLTTAILHSSGAFDSIIVAFVCSQIMPINLAVATLIGAEIGTTVTPLLVSTFGYIREKSKLSSSYYVTMSHFLYNLLTLMIFYPLELFFGFFTKLSVLGSSLFSRMEWLDLIPSFVDTITPWIPVLMQYIPPWITMIIGGATIILSLWGLERYMTALFSMPKSWNLIRGTFMKPFRAFLAGLLFTILVPSTTVMVSLLVPLAASGVISAEYYILPYVLGANIGTVFDVMLAALATGNPISLGVWLVHLSINLIGALIFFPLLGPFSRLARWSSKTVTRSPKITLIFLTVFHVVPIAIILSYLL